MTLTRKALSSSNPAKFSNYHFTTMEVAILYQNSVLALIKHRKSWRSFHNKVIEDHKRIQIQKAFSDQKANPFGSDIRFELIEDSGQNLGTVPGTYGVIRGAQHFILGIIKKNTPHIEDLGYALEKIILLATDLELGTCWMGGTFKKEHFNQTISLGKNEIIAVVTPLGYPSDKCSLIDRIFRGIAKSKTRLNFNELFYLNDFNTPYPEDEHDSYLTVLEHLRLAPSASNKQPWRIVKNKKHFHFYMKRTKNYQKVTMADLQRIDMGIAMSHFELVCNELGLQGKWQYNKQKNEHSEPELSYCISWLIND